MALPQQRLEAAIRAWRPQAEIAWSDTPPEDVSALWANSVSGQVHEHFPVVIEQLYAWAATPNASPSIATVDGVDTRRNLATRPMPVSGGGWTSNAAYPVVIDPAGGRGPRAAAVATRTGVSPSSTIASVATVGAASTSTGRSVVQPGVTYTASAYVKADRDTYRTRLIVRWYTAGGATISDSDTGLVPVAPSAGQWHRATLTAVAPATAATALISAVTLYTTAGNAIEGEKASFCDAQIEEGPVATAWFYGDTPDVPASGGWTLVTDPQIVAAGATYATTVTVTLAVQELCDELTAAGVPAVTDARDLNVPGAWVAPTRLDYDRLDQSSFTLELDLYLVTSDSGAVTSLGDLMALSAMVRAVLPVEQATPVTVSLDNQAPGGLPALQVPIRINVTQE